MLQPFATKTIAFIVIGVHGEINGKICKDITSKYGQHMLRCFATMTIIFTIISVHGEIDGKFARTQPTILTNACCDLLQQ